MAIRISKPDAQLPRNAFDLSQRHVFTSRVGHQIPVLAIDCVPGDYHEINTLSLTRTMPIQTDAFTALKQNFNFVFVPYQQIWRHWNDFINQSAEHFSTYEGTVNQLGFTPYTATNVPHFNLRTLIYALHDIFHLITTASGSSRLLNTSPNAAGVHPIDIYREIDGILRLLDLLGYGAYYDYVYNEDEDTSDFDDVFPVMKPNLFRLCAYQKAWFDYTRNSIYDSGSVMSFNMDYLTKSVRNGEFDFTDFTDALTNARSLGWSNCNLSLQDFDTYLSPFLLHNAQWQKDKFTSLYPNPQFGSLSEITLDGINIVNNLSLSSENRQAGVELSTGLLYRASGTTESSTNKERSSWTINNAFSVYELRYAQMVQKWKEDKMRAGNRTKDIARAIFGEAPKYAMDQYSDFVDAFSDYINISEVMSTAETSGAALGQIAGKGVGAGNHTVKFNCSDYGVLLCLYDVVPNVEYDALMCDKQNTMVEFANFFNPYFMDQGFEPVTMYELCTHADVNALNFNANSVLGYAPHDQCYKQAVSKVHGEFMSGGTLSHWVTPRKNLVERVYSSSQHSIYVSDMYVVPSDVDNIFYSQDSNVAYSDSVWYQEYDQLLNNFNFDIKSVRNMSVLGLPRW